jgi:cardiolipin synthase (CMP-forming)
MNLPNLLTLSRILLIPLFVILIINKNFGWALVTFAVAGITDGVDGLVARLTRQRTELGAYLDPIADKLLLSAAFITLAIDKILPSWLTVIVITRDVIILLGFFVFILTNHRPKMQPSFISKITTGFQITTILLALLRAYVPGLTTAFQWTIYGTTLFTILSGTHYLYLGTKILSEKAP